MRVTEVRRGMGQMQGETLLPFFAMEYVPGSRSITDYAQNEHLSREGRLELFLLVCNAVQYGHGRGIIHRDLKPHNILLKKGYHVKLCDFGFAYNLNSSIKIHCGSPIYMAPEIINCKEYDDKSDLWSLGIILHEMIFKKFPYKKSNNINELIKNIKNSFF